METPKYEGSLRKFMLNVPEAIDKCSGIVVFGRKIKSVVFSTDVSAVANCNADAALSLYPFTPQPVITEALLSAASVPVFAGVGGGWTKGDRIVELARHAEFQGSYGVVLTPRTPIETISAIAAVVDVPVIVTVVSAHEDIDAYIRAGASILNITAAEDTVSVVKSIRSEFPDVAIIASGGPTDETITETIEAGANAITWTPPASTVVFKQMMDNYRLGLKNE